MTPRRIRAVRSAARRATVVIEAPERLPVGIAELLRDRARQAFPGKRIVVLDGGMTARVER